jgi:glycosyltransferase involved in cell wall biosynthesis
MPAVSIAIRAFRRRWLTEAIASVLAQTHRDLELVIYDDAGDLEALATATGDPRVRYHRAEERRTASGRFTAAVAQCRGEYIGILDDDDAYAPDFVAALVRALDADPRCGVAFCRSTWDDGGELIVPADPRPAGRQADYAASMLRHGWWTAFSEMLIRRSALEAALRDQPLPSDVGPDTFINLRIALAGWTHVLVDGRLSRRRWHASQLSRTFPVADDMSVATFRRLSIADPILMVVRDRQLARSHLVRALYALLAGDVLEARVDVGAAVSLAPAAWRAERRALALAVACGPAGVLAARLWAGWSPRGRMRARPPDRIGHH